jgi:dTDP-4-amino-4,6-dideoxygalactose transaminase
VAVKFLDLSAQNREICVQISKYHEKIHADAGYIGGPYVTEFESRWAAFVGVAHAVAVASGTDALRLALLALDIGPGDEVITVPMTFVATAAAISQTGARPVFVDVDPVTGTMSVEALSRYLEKAQFCTRNGPRAIMPVHLYGMPAVMDEILAVARRFSLPVVEDACQAHGARFRFHSGWKSAGGMGAIGCFSFYPGKNLGAWGDAGAVTTDDPELALRIARLRDHGRISHYQHQEWGYTARLDALQAAVLLAKMGQLSKWNQRRREIAHRYQCLFEENGLILPQESEKLESCYHLFVIRSPLRDRIQRKLAKLEVGSGVHYPVPLHLQPACRTLGYRTGDFPASEEWANTVLSLPIHPHLTDADLLIVADAVHAAF